MAKRAYKIRNWSDYNKSLVKRGSLTLWFDEKYIAEWHKVRNTGNRGRPKNYSDVAILCMLRFEPQIFEINQNPDCPLCTGRETFGTLWSNVELGNQRDYNIMSDPNTQLISIEEFVALEREKSAYFLLDVRTQEEFQAANLGGYLIPLLELSNRLAEIPKNKLIIVYCRSGHRSQSAVEILQQAGFPDVKNLVGGILAWQHRQG